MKSILLRPFTAIWQALVRHQRKDVHNDPDIALLRSQQRDSQRANRRLNMIEKRYLGGRRHDS